MRFGVIVNSDEDPARDPAEHLDEHLERAHTARDCGFDMVAVGHRYSIGPAQADDRGEPLVTARMQPLPLLAALAGDLRDTMSYATTVLVSTSAHPVQLAEDVATLDKLCHGRLHLGIGLGWMPYEFEAFGVDPRTRLGRFVELVDLTRRLLTEDRVTYEGRHFQVRDVRMLARCVQQPMAPLWIGASKDAGVVRAAGLGDAWVVSGHIALADLERQLPLYLDERRRLGLAPPSQLPMVRLVYVAETREEALRAAEPALREWYRKRGEWGWFLTRDGADALADEAFRSGRWIIGDPEDCIEQIARLRQRLGVTHLIFVWPGAGPGSSRRERLRTIRLLGERVLPAFADDAGAPPVGGALTAPSEEHA